MVDKIRGDPEDYMRRPPTYAKKDTGEGPVLPGPMYSVVDAPDVQTRAFRINKDDFASHVATQGCAGCRAVINKCETRDHSKTCRERFENILK